MFELSRLEGTCGNLNKQREYLEELLNTKIAPSANVELGIIEYNQGNEDKAINHLERTIGTKNEDYALPILINIYIKKGNIHKAFEYIKYAREKNVEINVSPVLYVMTRLNIFFKDTDLQIFYNASQIMNYDIYTAVEHVIERHKDEFTNGIDIYRLFNRVSLDDEYYQRNITFNNIYDIPYENIGENIDILRVITLPNSKNILTMYPLYNKDDMDENDIQMKRRK